ncbi:MAG: GAF domain-containing protein, partial [Thermomicrobiales bacterium]
LELAHNVNLDPGTKWLESTAGTNAMGTSLTVDHPIQVFSAEHFSAPLEGWTCSAAPIHDPETRCQLGVIDLSGRYDTAHPHSLALVAVAARMVEAELAALRFREHEALVQRYGDRVSSSSCAVIGLASSQGTVLQIGARGLPARRIDLPRDGGLAQIGDDLVLAEPLENGGFLLWPADSSALPPPLTIRIEILGRNGGIVRLRGEAIELSPRQTEVLLLLALHSQGLSATQLAVELYGDLGRPVTARAEISRLRRVLDLDLGGRPYRLGARVDTDFEETEQLLQNGRLSEALHKYEGPMLPLSEAPSIVERREGLDHAIREAALNSEDVNLLHRWVRGPAGCDDLEACRLLAGLLEPGDQRRAYVLSRLRRLAHV